MCRRKLWICLVLLMSVGISQSGAEPKPIVYYPFDELVGTVLDASGHGNYGIPKGGISLDAGGVLGPCFRFNGTDGHVELKRPIQDDFSILAWIKTSETAPSGTNAFHGNGLFWSDVGGGNNDWVVGVLGTKLSFNAGNPNTSVNSNVDIVTGEWIHIATVRERASGTMTLYIDGEQDNSIVHANRGSLDAQPLLAIGGNTLDNRYYEGLIDEVLIYETPLIQKDIQAAMIGQTDEMASDPNPADGMVDVLRDTLLAWSPGKFAAAHNVYFGVSWDDVNDATVSDPRGVLMSEGQETTTFDPGRLAFETTYYWRVDEVNAPPDSTVFEGKVWNFTTELFAYPIENIITTASSSDPSKGPENTVNGSGLDESGSLHSKDAADNMWLSSMAGPQPTWIEFQFDRVYKLHELWVWNSNDSLEPVIGLGFKDVTIEYSVNGTDYTTLGTTAEFARAPGMSDYAHNTTIDFGGVAAKYVRLTANSNWGGILNQYGLSEVRFLHIPVSAREPYPDSGATGVEPDVVLGWTAGREAVTHDVYVGTDEQAVIDGTAPVTTVTEASHGPLALDLAQTYYWRVDEVNESETPTTWQGNVWDFATREFLIVDDFESYNDLDPGDPESNRIFNAWIDGYEVPTNGALVGYESPPFCEQTIVHSGEQSMPLAYSNAGGAAYSEAELSLSPPQDWTKAGIQTLVLYFYGAPGNTGKLYLKVNDSKVVYGGDAADIAKPRWKQWNIELASVGANLQSVTKLAIGIDGNGAAGTLYFDDIGLYALAPAVLVPSEEIWIEAEAATTITDPMKIYDDPAASGGKYIGTTDDVGNSSANPPAPAGTATYTFTVAGGTYKISCRIIIPSGDSFWVRIPGATTQTTNHSSGWVRWSDPPNSDSWYWHDVFSTEDNGETVLFTMPAGTYTLEIGYREDAALMDVIVISKID